MVLLKVTDIKHFMKKLLFENETAFDSFLLSEASIMTGNTITIDGHINKEFYSQDELRFIEETARENGRVYSSVMSRWSTLKGFCFQLIKGKKTPLSFRFVFYLADENIERFLNSVKTVLTRADIDGLTLNVKYDGHTLTCTTATSLNLFTLDKSIDRAWDDMIKKFFFRHEINFEEL
ncbi:MAG: DUF5721 family protein [Lachnospiraceae bacterium]